MLISFILDWYWALFASLRHPRTPSEDGDICIFVGLQHFFCIGPFSVFKYGLSPIPYYYSNEISICWLSDLFQRIGAAPACLDCCSFILAPLSPPDVQWKALKHPAIPVVAPDGGRCSHPISNVNLKHLMLKKMRPIYTTLFPRTYCTCLLFELKLIKNNWKILWIYWWERQHI